jgi:starch synthase
MTQTAAIYYAPDGYETGGERLLGRQAAGEGFLKGLVTHGSSAKFYCYAANKTLVQDFVRRVQPWAQRDLQVVWIPHGDSRGLGSAGTLYRPDTVLDEHAWHRRHRSQRDYSLCGVTHTIATRGALDALGRLMLAPLQSWDALICTSQAVRAAVDRIHGSLGEYLAQRFGGGEFTPKIQLPVIPLGVNTDQFADSKIASASRAALRTELGIVSGDVLVLYVGRLIHYAKAHPIPMYLALEKAARKTPRKIHLIQAGWFEQEGKVEQDFKDAAQQLCPSVRCVFLDGRKPDVRSTVWAAADIFMSLSDNVQETFGITPIEAMAAGLPVVVSDWDGYRESVRDGVDGFRVPTVIPPAGAGLDWSAAFGANMMNYSTFIANAAMVTSVDVDVAARRVGELVDDAELRQRMGDAGRIRAREVYDWRVVIRAYEALWHELAEQRAGAAESAIVSAGAAANPWCDDPFRLFGHYASSALGSETRLTATRERSPEDTRLLHDHPLARPGREQRAPVAVIEQLLEVLRGDAPLSVQELQQRFSSVPTPVLTRTLVYLLKFDLISRDES